MFCRYRLLEQVTVDWAKAHRLYRDEENPLAPAPGESTALIHTRLGDVIDKSKYNASTIFKHATCYRGFAYVRPVGYHEQVAQQLKTFGVTKVVPGKNILVCC